jgi:hypothetical protein
MPLWREKGSRSLKEVEVLKTYYLLLKILGGGGGSKLLIKKKVEGIKEEVAVVSCDDGRRR